MYYPGTHGCNKDHGTNNKTTGKVQICENNLVRRIVGVNRADKTRMNELRVAIGVKESCKKKLVRIRLA